MVLHQELEFLDSTHIVERNAKSMLQYVAETGAGIAEPKTKAHVSQHPGSLLPMTPLPQVRPMSAKTAAPTALSEKGTNRYKPLFHGQQCPGVPDS